MTHKNAKCTISEENDVKKVNRFTECASVTSCAANGNDDCGVWESCGKLNDEA